MKMGAASAAKLSNGGGLVVVNADGSVSVTPAGGTGVLLGVAPPATANQGLLSLGNGPWDGLAAGHFVGAAAGTGYAANFTSGYAGYLLNLQVAGGVRMSCDQNGNVLATTMHATGFIKSDSSVSSPVYSPLNNSPANVGVKIGLAALQTADALQVVDSATHVQFGVANVGSGGSPIWALRVRATANAESMAQLHTLGSYSGRAVQYIDDAGATIGWAPLYN